MKGWKTAVTLSFYRLQEPIQRSLKDYKCLAPHSVNELDVIVNICSTGGPVDSWVLVILAHFTFTLYSLQRKWQRGKGKCSSNFYLVDKFSYKKNTIWGCEGGAENASRGLLENASTENASTCLLIFFVEITVKLLSLCQTKLKQTQYKLPHR